MSVDNRLPIEIRMSIASITSAVEYWLSNAVFDPDVEIEGIHFSKDEHFIIKIRRDSKND